MIVVYDEELKFVRQIVGVNNDTMIGLCPNSPLNVHVCDYENSSIQVYSKYGELLCCFGCDEKVVERLKWLWGVCVAGQYVYVTDVDIHELVLFTTEEDYVTYNSYGMCVDQDGFVYVIDYARNMINIY